MIDFDNWFEAHKRERLADDAFQRLTPAERLDARRLARIRRLEAEVEQLRAVLRRCGVNRHQVAFIAAQEDAKKWVLQLGDDTRGGAL